MGLRPHLKYSQRHLGGVSASIFCNYNISEYITLLLIFYLITLFLYNPGGILLFRDYALYDMTMIRFAPRSKIAHRFYTRQDGTRTFFFTPEDTADLGANAGFSLTENQEWTDI